MRARSRQHHDAGDGEHTERDPTAEAHRAAPDAVSREILGNRLMAAALKPFVRIDALRIIAGQRPRADDGDGGAAARRREGEDGGGDVVRGHYAAPWKG